MPARANASVFFSPFCNTFIKTPSKLERFHSDEGNTFVFEQQQVIFQNVWAAAQWCKHWCYSCWLLCMSFEVTLIYIKCCRHRNDSSLFECFSYWELFVNRWVFGVCCPACASLTFNCSPFLKLSSSSAVASKSYLPVASMVTLKEK